MSKGIDLINSFIGRAFDTGKVCLIKCLDCGTETISLSIDEEFEFECSDCLSENVEIENLNSN